MCSVWALGTRYSGEDGKVVVWRVSESEQSIVWVYICQTLFSFALLSSGAMSLCFHLHFIAQSITLGLLPLHFGSRMIFFTCRLPPGRTLLHFGPRTCTIFWSPSGRTSSTWLVVWGQDHRNYAHSIKVWQIYIHTYVQTWPDYTAWLVASR